MNIIAIIVAAVINMVIGAVWYSPALFAKKWMSLTGRKMDAGGNANMGYAVAGIASLVTAYVLAWFVKATGTVGVMEGLKLGLMVGVGFVATVVGASYTFEGRPRNLYLINVGYNLVSLMVMAAVLAAWSY